jgi:glycosyltransferase involved in cell wall biosynthesis
MVKIALFHNECAPYTLPLFAKISQLSGIDLKVYFGRYRSSDRRWNIDLNVDFQYEILKEVKALTDLFSIHPELDASVVNPPLFFKLIAGRYDVIMGGCPYYFDTQLAFVITKVMRKPFILGLEDIDLKGPGRSFKESLWSTFLNLGARALVVPFCLVKLAFSRLVLRYSDAYIVPGLATREYLIRRGIPNSKIFIAVNAIDNELIKRRYQRALKNNKPEKLKKRLGLEGKKIILSVGYLQEYKGFQYLIQAYARMKNEDPKVVLILVGDGPYKEELSRITKEKGVNVIFTGYVSDLELVDYYSIADVFVLPSLDDPWGYVINEAMVCGCPIIATSNVGASKDLVKNGINGYIIQPGNVSQLCYTVKKILYNHGLRRRMMDKSREIIKNFTYEKSVEGFKSAIDYVCATKKNRVRT